MVMPTYAEADTNDYIDEEDNNNNYENIDNIFF